MEMLHGLMLYEIARDGIFKCETNMYDLKTGWIQENKTLRIIGEDNHCYVVRTIVTNE